VPEWLRSWLRRFGIGERRWIPDLEEREEHRTIVRSRLAQGPVRESAAEDARENETSAPR
jgi:hypothetical protein